MTEDLTAAEAVAAIAEITKDFPRSWETISLEKPGRWHFRIYPFGYGAKSGLNDEIVVKAKGETIREVIETIRADFPVAMERFQGEAVRKMALAIIAIRAEVGEVTPAALRNHDFTMDEIDRLGPAAVADANAIADNGPFSIVDEAATPNGAPADDEVRAPADDF